MKIIECVQGTDEWKQARCGLVTASRISDVLAKKESVARRDYKFQIVSEILTGKSAEDGYTNKFTEWGIEQEKFARSAYEMKSGELVEQVGFVLDEKLNSGVSPDGLIGEEGLIEIKCPKTSTHIKYLLEGKIPTEYIGQILWQLRITGREWCDFVSFDPRLDEKNQLFVMRLKKDKDSKRAIADIESEVKNFIGEVNEIVEKLRS